MPETIDLQLAYRQIVWHSIESPLAKIQLSIANIAIEPDDQFAQIANLPDRIRACKGLAVQGRHGGIAQGVSV